VTEATLCGAFKSLVQIVPRACSTKTETSSFCQAGASAFSYFMVTLASVVERMRRSTPLLAHNRAPIMAAKGAEVT
jgi:hypothetical protein